jgi:hypothetical protein
MHSQVWLQDLSCQWQYVCEGFTDYFRLMILHLGISGWQVRCRMG